MAVRRWYRRARPRARSRGRRASPRPAAAGARAELAADRVDVGDERPLAACDVVEFDATAPRTLGVVLLDGPSYVAQRRRRRARQLLVSSGAWLELGRAEVQIVDALGECIV